MVVAALRVLTGYLSERSEENHDVLLGYLFPGRDLNIMPSE
jgi:hypothetical protein